MTLRITNGTTRSVVQMTQWDHGDRASRKQRRMRSHRDGSTASCFQEMSVLEQQITVDERASYS